MDNSKFNAIKPKEENATMEYIKKIKETKEKKRSIYIPYGTQYADIAKVNCYMKDKINELVIEYDVPQEINPELTKKIKLIVAEKPAILGEFSKAVSILKDFLKKSTMFATLDALRPEIYVASLEKMGWTFTQEGIDFMGVTKSQGIVEIEKSKFIRAEDGMLDDEEFQNEEKLHAMRVDKEIIKKFKNYIIETYESIPEKDIDPKLHAYKKKVLLYDFNEKSGVESKHDLLSHAFSALKPIHEQTGIIPLMRRKFLATLREVLELIPKEYQEPKLQKMLNQYLDVRETAIDEKEENNGELRKNSIVEYGVHRVMADYRDVKQRRLDLRKKADKILEAFKKKEDELEK